MNKHPELSINLDAISKNWLSLNTISNKNVETGAVLKANAYGLGAKVVAPHLWKAGVKSFFAASLEEAIELRECLPKKSEIYYFNGFFYSDIKEIRAFRLTPILNTTEQIKAFSENLSEHPVAIHADVGINRLGLSRSELVDMKPSLDCLKITLMLGHLSSADDIFAPETTCQLMEFRKVSSVFPKIKKSLSATGGVLLGSDFHFQLTRPGIGLYGGLPFKKTLPVVTLKLPILQTKVLQKNVGVGYNHMYKTPSRKTIAIVAAGYADGLFRNLSNKGALYSGKHRCPIVGRVSMDLITVDISSLTQIPKCLDVLCEEQTIDDLAHVCNTIGYEVLTSLGSRYKRTYLGEET